MNIFPPRLFRFALPLLAGAAFVASGAEKTAKPPERKTEKIEFSGGATRPVLSKPGEKFEDLDGRLGPERGSGPAPGPDFGSVGPQAPALNKKVVDKLLLEYDKKKNWMVPGAQEQEDSTALDHEEIGLVEKGAPKTVLEKFFEKADSKTKRSQGLSSKDPERESDDDTRDNNDPDKDLDSKRERDIEPESNGFRDFNLRSYLNPGQTQRGSTDPFIGRPDSGLQRSLQTLGADRTMESNRRTQQEKEAARAAEFQQLIRPRSGGATLPNALPDPINSQADATRRELNPVSPLSSSRSESVLREFNSPATRSSPISDSGMFGIAAPPSAASSITPAFTPPAAGPALQGAFAPGSIIHERPKRPF